MEVNSYMWTGFIVLVIIMLVIDLGVFHRQAHEVKLKEALSWSAVWIALSLIFNAVIWHYMGKVKALEFFTGYLIEKSLSVDNLFVFIMLFSYFRVDPRYQHKVLFWGIIGALIMRAIFIFAGVALLEKFHWLIYIFGGFLIYSGIAMLKPHKEEIDPDKNPLVRLFTKFFPVTKNMHGSKFFVRINTRLFATPLFIVLLIVEFTDLIFAVDSIPAILAVTTDTFIVFTSNVFAILGLRALYFALAGITEYFYYLKYGLAAILAFVGSKMILAGFDIKIEIVYSLIVIFTLLTLSILASLVFPVKKVVPTGKPEIPKSKDV